MPCSIHNSAAIRRILFKVEIKRKGIETMEDRVLHGVPVGLQSYIDNACDIIQKSLTEAGLQAKVYQAGPNIEQMTENLWFTDIDVRLLLNISARVEPIGLVDINHV
jgi:hypothetical protein